MKTVVWLLLSLLLISFNCYADDEDSGKDFPQVYHIFDSVDLITTERYYDEQNPKISVKAVYPQLEGDQNDQAITAFNEQTRALIKHEIAAFRTKIKELRPYNDKQAEETSTRNRLFIDYNSSSIKAGGDHLLSVRFSIQGYISSMAHGYHYHRVLNFDLDTGEKMELADLFAPQADYLGVLSDYARISLSKHLANKDMVMEGTMPTLNNFKNWNLKPDGLFITFDEYQVAPYVNGAQTVLIPYPNLKLVTNEDSIIVECVDHPSKCRRGKLLTGGFIDEARNTHNLNKTKLTINKQVPLAEQKS